MPPEATLSEATRRIIEAGRWLDARGWTPATSGNCSMRLDAERAAVTVSGSHKGHLTDHDVTVVDYDGEAIDGRRPSAETLLHTLIYRLDPSCGAVLHVHSVHSTVLGMTLDRGKDLELSGYELLKALPGVTTHEARVVVPLFDNTQDMAALAREVAERWRKATFFGYLIRGHGLYAWGRTMDEALRSVEAFEFLFACELERMALSP